MSQKGSARPTVGAAERAEAGKILEDIHSRSYCTSPPATKQPQISDLLSTGQENAVTLRDLRSMTGLDGRTIRLAIERERRGGIPILSDRGGYYLPAAHTEIERFVQSMLRRAREIEITARAVRRCRFD